MAKQAGRGAQTPHAINNGTTSRRGLGHNQRHSDFDALAGRRCGHLEFGLGATHQASRVYDLQT